MTANREAMTERQAFEKWASDKLLGGVEKRIAWLTWQAAVATHPPEPVRDAVQTIRNALMLSAWSSHNDSATAAQMRQAALLLFGQEMFYAAMAQESGE